MILIIIIIIIYWNIVNFFCKPRQHESHGKDSAISVNGTVFAKSFFYYWRQINIK